MTAAVLRGSPPTRRRSAKAERRDTTAFLAGQAKTNDTSSKTDSHSLAICPMACGATCAYYCPTRIAMVNA